ncbi:MAG: hypothetical protein P4L49_03480 [Desulfosporosinus sp.]|nr:hypothetical protein [Desulfosporosinus sp.]
MAQYRNWLKDYINKKDNILSIDFWMPFFTAIQVNEAAKLYVDEVHPSIAGYKLMGEIALHSLESLIALS